MSLITLRRRRRRRKDERNYKYKKGEEKIHLFSTSVFSLSVIKYLGVDSTCKYNLQKVYTIRKGTHKEVCISGVPEIYK